MRVLSLFIAVCLTAIGAFVLPGARGAGQWLLAKDDPVALTQLGLRAKLTPERLNAELAAALDAQSQYLADSFVVLAAQERVAITAALRKRYDERSASFFAPIEMFARGLFDGRCTSNAGFAGARIGDLAIGDLLDLYNEAQNFRAGRPVDEIIVGLSAVSLVSTTALPLRVAMSAMKGAAKAGRLPQPFRAELTKALTSALDPQAVMRLASEIGLSDLAPRPSWEGLFPEVSLPLVPKLTAALGALVNLDALAPFMSITNDLVVLARGDTGICGAQDALAVIHDSGELKRVLRLAEVRKGATAAVLKVLGRDALVLPEQKRASAFGWVGGGVGYLVFGLAALWRGVRGGRRR